MELRIVDVQEAQTHLSKLLEQVSLGEDIIIAGVEIAAGSKRVPVSPSTPSI